MPCPSCASKTFFIQKGTFRNGRLREGYIPPLPWCGGFVGGAVRDRRCRGRRNASPTGSNGGAELDRWCRGRTHRYAPTDSFDTAYRIDTAPGGGTPPLRILREIRKKPVSPRAVDNRPYGVCRRCGLGLPVYHWMGACPCCCRKALILEKGRLPKKPR